jgi:16S rRNA (adenine1518-N6/adenine1519-N6)-dimethyltransferase
MTFVDALQKLPPLREIIMQYKLSAQKKFGQNFILDLNLTRRIARTAKPLNTSTIIEIGPGPGGLTRALFLEGATNVIAIEKDPRCLEALKSLQDIVGNRLTLIEGDALEIDYNQLCPGPKKIVANLPYNISTPLLINWLKHMDSFLSLTLLFQKEVATRITAKPHIKEYGRLSILSQLLSHPTLAFDIAPSAFVPAPKVTSTLVHFVARDECPESSLVDILEKLTSSAFNQRRKMLRGSLKSVHPDIIKILDDLNIDPVLRAENLSPNDFLNISKAIQLLT